MPSRSRRPRRAAPSATLLTVRDAARRVGLAYGTFRAHVLPKLGARRVGRRWIITSTMLTDFLNGPAGREMIGTGRVMLIRRKPAPPPHASEGG